MTIENLKNNESLGIFELDDSGKVIHSNFEGSNGWLGFEHDLKGRDFFDEVLGLTNVEELRRRLDNFKADRLPAYSFDFICQFQRQSIPIRVLLAKRNELTNEPRSILVHLRRCSAQAVAKAVGDDGF
jgi:hypothetical protein